MDFKFAFIHVSPIWLCLGSRPPFWPFVKNLQNRQKWQKSGQFQTIFQSWRIKLRVLKFFRPILIIKRHQKNTQAKLFEKFASRQHALVDNQLRWYKWSIQKTQDRYHLFRQITEKRIWAQKTNNQVKGWMREFRSPASLFQKASWLGFFVFVLVFLSEFVLVFVLWTVSSGGLHWIGKNIYVFVVVFLYFLC